MRCKILTKKGIAQK